MRLLENKYDHTINPIALNGQLAAEIYNSAKHEPLNLKVQNSYSLLKENLLEQWEFIEPQIEVTGYQDEETAPYANSKELLRDIEKNHIWYLKTSDNDVQHFLHDHPMLTKVKTQKLGVIYLNDLFRIVHDVYGHYAAQSSFSLQGEMLAWLEHRKMFPQEALMALWCETRGQASWTNCWKDNAELPLKDRPFALQKAALVSENFI